MAKTAAALHILVKEESLAKELLLRLQKGASFQQLAKNTRLPVGTERRRTG